MSGFVSASFFLVAKVVADGITQFFDAVEFICCCYARLQNVFIQNTRAIKSLKIGAPLHCRRGHDSCAENYSREIRPSL